MLEIITVGFFTISIIFFIILWIDNCVNRNDEFIEVKEWHNFRNAFNQSNKGEK